MRMRNPEEAKQYERYYRWHNIIYQFNLKKIEILKSREALSEQRVAITQELALLKQVTQKDLIEVITAQAEIASTLNIYQSYNDQLVNEIQDTSNLVRHYPLFDIDYTYTFKLLTSEEPDSVTQLMLENIALENKAIHDFTLRPFVNYNFYDLVGNNPPSRNFFSVGVQFIAPLNFNTRNKNELRQAQAEYVGAVPEQTVEQHGDILNKFYEFRYKLKQYVNMYNKRKMFEELLRKERVKYNISTRMFNPITALDLLDNLMQIDIELTDLHQQMYLKLLDIYTEIPYSDGHALVTPINVDGK
jgi:rubrerythrin